MIFVIESQKNFGGSLWFLWKVYSPGTSWYFYFFIFLNNRPTPIKGLVRTSVNQKLVFNEQPERLIGHLRYIGVIIITVIKVFR